MGIGSLPSSEFERRIGYVFHDKSLLTQALTHSTHAYEKRGQLLPDNERLEFLGDSILGLVIGKALFEDREQLSEGEMTATRALVVCEQSLASVARKIDLGTELLLGIGEEKTGGRNKDSNLSNAMEAVFGATFVDGGFDAVQTLVLSLMGGILRDALAGDLVRDFKSRLIEKVQSGTPAGSIRFILLEESGKEHERVFRTSVEIDGMPYGEGIGKSKKESEQAASRTALRALTDKERI